MGERLVAGDVPVTSAQGRGETAAGGRDRGEAESGQDPRGARVPGVRLQQWLTLDVQLEELAHAATVATCQDA